MVTTTHAAATTVALAIVAASSMHAANSIAPAIADATAPAATG